MKKFLAKHWESLIFTAIMIMFGVCYIVLTVPSLLVVKYTLMVGLVYYAVKAIVFAKEVPGKIHMILHYIEAAADIGILFYMIFGIVEFEFQIPAILFLIMPVVKTFFHDSWISQVYLDRTKYFFGILYVILPLNRMISIGSYGLFITVGVIFLVLAVIMIYYLIFYGRILSEKEYEKEN